MSDFLLRDCKVIFATNHHKAQAAREPFARVLNAIIEELSIDSDSVGTFSGEVERPGSMLDALREKVRLARQYTSERFVLTSEGSFSTSGGFGIVAQGIEMLLLHDSTTGAEVLEQHVSWNTNYATQAVTSLEQLKRFLALISFGSHALVLYPLGVSLSGHVLKGLTGSAEVERAFAEAIAVSPSKSVMVMSDMRAHVNPTRMKAISACSELLAQRLNTLCPSCGSAGFGLVESISGLPCEWCGTPTQRARAERHACVLCKKSAEMPRSDGLLSADSSECAVCNP